MQQTNLRDLLELEQRLKLRCGAQYAIHGVSFDFALCIDYLAVTNHHAGGIRHVQKKTGYDSDHLFNLPECLASECQQSVRYLRRLPIG